MKPNMGNNKVFVDLEYDDEGNELEKNLDDVDDDDVESIVDENVVATAAAAVIEDSEEDLPLDKLVEKNRELGEKVSKISDKLEIHDRLRSNLRSNADKAMDRMEKKHNHKRNKKTCTYEIGNVVSVKIPSIDHGGTELRRLACVVSEVKHEKYVLTCESGVLEDLYRADELELYHGLIEFDYSKITNKISLRSAAIAAAGGKRSKPIDEIEVDCDCKGKCSDRRCKCFARQFKCNSHCHGKNSINCNNCTNKD
jgi:hypothetical protein